MHRKHLLELLDSYLDFWQDEKEVVARIRTLVQQHTDCFDRTCRPGHITASAWIVSADHKRSLLTHHKKLEKWLQLGGHADGQTVPLDVALREAVEESGLQGFRIALPPIRNNKVRMVPLDLDVHVIPARYDSDGTLIEDAHEHHDIRYLLIAEGDETITVSHESHDVAWLTPKEVHAVTQEESVLRLLRKAKQWLSAP